MLLTSFVSSAASRLGLRQLAWALTVGACVALPASADAQCAGDCDGSGGVAINELILAVNIALGGAPAANCTAVDTNSDGMVAINELIAAVGSALNGCLPGATPTATAPAASPTATPTDGGGATPTATVDPSGAICGDGTIELDKGETCDDGNTDDTDTCPANCRVAPCEPTTQRLQLDVNFVTDDGQLFLIGMSLFLRYPDGVVSIPASLDQPPVLERVTSEIFALGLNDTDFSVLVQAQDPLQFGYQEGVALSAEFDLCEGATAPAAGDFTCVVNDAVDVEFNSIPGERVECTLSIVP